MPLRSYYYQPGFSFSNALTGANPAGATTGDFLIHNTAWSNGGGSSAIVTPADVNCTRIVSACIGNNATIDFWVQPYSAGNTYAFASTTNDWNTIKTLCYSGITGLFTFATKTTFTGGSQNPPATITLAGGSSAAGDDLIALIGVDPNNSDNWTYTGATWSGGAAFTDLATAQGGSTNSQGAQVGAQYFDHFAAGGATGSLSITATGTPAFISADFAGLVLSAIQAGGGGGPVDPIARRARAIEAAAYEERVRRAYSFPAAAPFIPFARRGRNEGREAFVEERQARLRTAVQVLLPVNNPPTRRARALQEDTPEERAARRTLVPPRVDNPPTRRRPVPTPFEDPDEVRSARRFGLPQDGTLASIDQPQKQRRPREEDPGEERSARRQLEPQDGTISVVDQPQRARRAREDDAQEERSADRSRYVEIQDNPPIPFRRNREEESQEERTPRRTRQVTLLDNPPPAVRRDREEDAQEERAPRRTRQVTLLDNPPPPVRRNREEDAQEDRTPRRTRYLESVDGLITFRKWRTYEDQPEDRAQVRRFPLVPAQVDNPPTRRSRALQEDTPEEHGPRRGLVPVAPAVVDNPPTRRKTITQEDQPEERAARRALVPPPQAAVNTPPTARARLRPEETQEERAARRTLVPPRVDNPPTRRGRPTQEDQSEDRAARRPLAQAVPAASLMLARRPRAEEVSTEERSRRPWVYVDRVDVFATRHARHEELTEGRQPRKALTPTDTIMSFRRWVRTEEIATEHRRRLRPTLAWYVPIAGSVKGCAMATSRATAAALATQTTVFAAVVSTSAIAGAIASSKSCC